MAYGSIVVKRESPVAAIADRPSVLYTHRRRPINPLEIKQNRTEMLHLLDQFCLAFALLLSVRALRKRHLAGILMGYLMAWRFLEYLSTPILAGFFVVFMLQHSKGWARNMPDFSLLLQEWAGGDVFRVKRARMLSYVWGAHL